MRAITPLFFALVVATLAPAGAARADVAPPDDYVDPCASMTFEASCRRCTVPEFKSHDCHEGARAAGLVERCRGWNYAMYCGEGGTPPPPEPRNAPELPLEPRNAPKSQSDVRSPPPTPASAPPPAVATSGGCMIHDGRDVASFALVLLLAAVLRRRRAA